MSYKKAQVTAPDNINDIKKSVQTILTRLQPMIQQPQNVAPAIKQIAVDMDTINKQLDQLALQVGQLEQLKGQSQQAAASDQLSGGVGDDVSEDEVNKEQLDMGQKVEREHTDNKDLAREIARDHLAEELNDGKDKEDQDYYTRLKTIHDDKCQDANDVPDFWRNNLDYGARVSKAKSLASLANLLDESGRENEADAIDNILKQIIEG